MNLLKQISILMVLLLLLTGCWDKVEIEERAFIYGIAVDLAEGHTTSNTQIELTQQLIVPEQLVTLGGGGGSGPAYRNLSYSGRTIIDTNREMIKQASRFSDATHVNVVLFSEDLAKQPNLFKEYIDVFLREKDMRRGIIIAITSGKAGELLSIEPEHEKIPSQYISKLMEARGNLEIMDIVRIGDIQEKVLQKESFPLPQLAVMGPKIVNYDGIAIYQGQKSQMVGTLKGEEAKGLSILIGAKHTGTIDIELEGQTSTIEIIRIKNKIALENEDPSNLQFTMNMDITGLIAEQVGIEDVLSPETHEKFENELEKKIEEISTKTIDKLQKDFQADALGLGAHLHHFHPKLWEQVKDNWESGEHNFSNSKVNFKIDVTIERPGNINKTSAEE